jgi:hypothetical protein
MAERFGRSKEFIQSHKTELLLCLLALLLYIPGINWGLPLATSPERIQAWAQDDISPLGPLTETYNTFFQRAADRWLPYSLGHHFLLMIVYSPYLLFLMLTGKFTEPNPAYPFGFSNPVTTFQWLTILARLVSIGMAAGILVAAYQIGRILWDKESAVLASIILLLTYPMFYYSKTANLEIPSLLWTSLALLIYVKILLHGMDLKRAAWLGIFAALAVATKDQTAGVFFLPFLFLLPLYLKSNDRKESSAWGPPLVFLGTGLAVYALFSGLAFDPIRYFSHVNWLFYENPSLYAEYLEWFPLTIAGALGLLGEMLRVHFWIFGPVLLFAGLATMIYVSIRESLKLALVLPLVSYILTFVFIIHYFKIRYSMPMIFIFSLFAGRGIVLALKSWTPSIMTQLVMMILVFSWPAILSSDLLFQMFHDSRNTAGEWLALHLHQGSKLAYCGNSNNLPHTPENVELIRLPEGTSSVSYVKQYRPEFIVVLPDWTSKPRMEHSRSCSEEFFNQLQDGSLGYRSEAHFRTRSLIRTQLLDYPSVNPPVRIYVSGEKDGG